MLFSLQKFLKDRGLDAIIITSSDQHCLYQPPEHHRIVKKLSNFSDSYGTIIVTATNAAIFVAPISLAQAKMEVNNKIWEIKNLNYSDINKWLKDNTSGKKIAYNPFTTKIKDFSIFTKELKDYQLIPVPKTDYDLLLKENMHNTQDHKHNNSNLDYFYHNYVSSYCKSNQLDKSLHELDISNKLTKTIEAILSNNQNCRYYITSATDSICWLLNIRGYDSPFMAIALSFAIIDTIEKTLHVFIDIKKLDEQTKSIFKSNGIKVHEYHEFNDFLNQISAELQKQANSSSIARLLAMDFSANCCFIKDAAPSKQLIDMPCPITHIKSIKHDIELFNIKYTHVIDAVAVVRLLHWLDQQIILDNEVYELDIVDQLLKFRQQNSEFICPSFGTISAFGPNSAVIHYNPSTTSNRKIVKNGIFLLDSGGQYLGGTTDITRTVYTGTSHTQATDEQKLYFTLVLKGHINLAMTKFPENTYGFQLDPIARAPLWSYGLDYKHGTGHGVGYCLDVHEGPANIDKNIKNTNPLQKNMVLSNEPGFYIDNEYGIRTESLVCVQSADKSASNVDEYGNFLQFETLTLVPIDKKLINVELLNKQELAWINSYHKKVFETINPLLSDANEQKWLKNACSTLE